MNQARPPALSARLPAPPPGLDSPGRTCDTTMPTLRLTSLTPSNSRESLTLSEVEAKPRKSSDAGETDQRVIRIQVGDFDAAMAQVSDEIFEERAAF